MASFTWETQKNPNVLRFGSVIFGIVFGSFESYVFWNAGYPSTLMPSQQAVTISYLRILNVSLTDVVQSAEKTVAFSVLNWNILAT